MSKAIITEQHLHNIADAIIAKGGATAPMTPAEMPELIQAIPSGTKYPVPWKNDNWIHVWYSFAPNSKTNHAYIYTLRFISDGHTFDVDWGDGYVESIASSSGYTQRVLQHDYSDPGDYEVVIRGFDRADFAGWGLFGGAYNSNNYNQNVFQFQSGDGGIVDVSGINIDPGPSGGVNRCPIVAIKFPAETTSFTYPNALNNCLRLSVIDNLDFSKLVRVESSAFSGINLGRVYDEVDFAVLTYADSYAFKGIPIKKVIAKKLTEIRPSILNAAIEEIECSEELKVIYNYAFSGCVSLRSISGLGGLEEVMQYTAFDNTPNLALLEFLPKTHTEVEAITGFTNFPNYGQSCVFRCSDGDFYRSGSSLLPIS